jgi:hypothetical protein
MGTDASSHVTRPSGLRRNQTMQHPQQGAFATAIGTNQSQPTPLGNLQINAFECRTQTKTHTNGLQVKLDG